MDFLERLKTLMDKEKLNKRQLALRANLPPTTIYGLFSKGYAALTYPTLKAISEYFGVSMDYMVGDTDIENGNIEPKPLSDAAYKIGHAYEKAPVSTRRIVDVALEPYMSEVKHTDMETAEEIAPVMMKLPAYYEPAAAGTGNYLTDTGYEMISFPVLSVPHNANICVWIEGDSMEPRFHDGDLVFVNFRPAIENGQIGIFSLNNKAYCKKLVVDHEKHQTRLVSLNPKYEDILIKDGDDLRTYGCVLGIAPKSK